MHLKNLYVKKGRSLAKKLVACISAAGLAAVLVPAAAFATDTMSASTALPSASEVISFEHTATDNDASYTYRYVTIGSSSTSRVAPMAETYYEVLGLNYVNAYTGPGTIFSAASEGTLTEVTSSTELNSSYTTGSIGSLQTFDAPLSIMGTSNNENPDEYVWNYCCWANGGSVNADSRAVDHGNSSTIGTGAISVTINSTEYSDFPREIYTECDIVNASSSSDTYGDSTWTTWVGLENARTSRPKSDTYDPAFATFSATSGGGATMISGLHTLAETIDSVVADSVDSNGNYTLQSRYGGNTSDGTSSNIEEYEDLVQATQYYVLSQLDAGTIERATTAVLVGYDPSTGNYACRKYGVTSGSTSKANDPETNYYGGRIANYVCSFSDSITSLGLNEAQDAYSTDEANYIAWYTPEQIIANCDAAFVCDAPSSNSISSYLASASDGQCYTVYAPATRSSDEEDRTEGLTTARNSAKSAGTAYADLCFSYPCTMFGNFYAQGVENGLIAAVTAAFTYPEILDLTDMLGYWAKYVWHIKDDSIQTIVTSACSGMSLSSDQSEVGTVDLSTYESTVESIFNTGNAYYILNSDTIDDINSGNLETYDMSALVARTDVTSYVESLVSSASKSASKSAVSSYIAKVKTLVLNSKTVKASSIKSYKGLTTVYLGSKVKKIKASTFKGSKVKNVYVLTKKLKKAKSVAKCFKGSKAKKVTVHYSFVGKKFVKKSFTKKNTKAKKMVLKK